MKRCGKCGEEKPLTDFNRNKATSDGLFAFCRSCQSQVKRDWYARNKQRVADYWGRWYAEHKADLLDRQRPYRRAYYLANRERIISKSRDWRATNRLAHRQYSKEWREGNKERHLAGVVRWKLANPDRALENRRVGKRRRRARECNAEGTHTASDVRAQYKRQKGACYWCNAKVGDTYHVDHVVPLSRGGSNWPENLVIACPSCNMSKSNKLPHEWAQGGRLI